MARGEIAMESPPCDGVIHRGQLDGEDRHYRIYLPPLQRIVALEIGSRQSLNVTNANAKPIVYCTHRAPISRAGMTPWHSLAACSTVK